MLSIGALREEEGLVIYFSVCQTLKPKRSIGHDKAQEFDVLQKSPQSPLHLHEHLGTLAGSPRRAFYVDGTLTRLSGCPGILGMSG